MAKANKDANLTSFLRELKELEGNKLHRNKTEADVTTAYGIYLKDRSDTKIYKYISNLGQKLGYSKDTSLWDEKAIEVVNKNIDQDEQYKHVVDFYKGYFKSLGIEDLHPAIALNICNLFVNSRKLGVLVLQKSTNEMINILRNNKKYLGQLPSLVDEDGLIGPKTRETVKELSKLITEEEGFAWNSIGAVISCKEYVELVKRKPEMKLYLNGWLNRVLENMRDNVKVAITY